jgi:hypothetical protein
LKSACPKAPINRSQSGISTQVDQRRGGPAERADQLGGRLFGGLVVAADEHVVLTGNPPGLHHHVAVHGVQRLDHAHGGERALNLLTEAIGVHRVQRGRHAAAEVQRVGHVDEHLPGQRRLTGGH